MARKPVTDMSAWPSLTLEGNLIAPAMVASIDRRQAAEQTEADYRIRKGLTIREEISTAFRVGQSHFDAFAKLQNPSVEATRRFVRGFLARNLRLRRSASRPMALISFLAGGRVPDRRRAAFRRKARPAQPDTLDRPFALAGLRASGLSQRQRRRALGPGHERRA